MKIILKGLVLLMVLAIVTVVGGAYLIPPVAVVERAAQVQAPPDKIYPIISNMRRFNEWSPWAELDPAATYTFEGPDGGVGQRMMWSSGNPQVGKGSQTIVEADPGKRIVTELDFGKMGKARSIITLKPLDEGTAVIWSFEAPAEGILERWMSLMFDKWVGADYVKGLARLKLLAERESSGG